MDLRCGKKSLVIKTALYKKLGMVGYIREGWNIDQRWSSFWVAFVLN
jgi:hypothetical protein